MEICAELIKSAVLGLAVGDAFGMPYETVQRGAIDIRKEADDGHGGYALQGYRKGMPAYWYQEDMPAGTWTDDTAMVLAQMESVSRLGRVDPEDMMRNFCRWYYDGAFTPFGRAIGEGRRTVAALGRYRSGVRADACGGSAPEDNGNGSLMRMLPFAFLEEMMRRSGVTAGDLSRLTHAHPIAVTACELYVAFARRLLAGEDRHAILPGMGDMPAPFERLARIEALEEEEIQSTGYVVCSLEAALWCFLRSESYEECVLRAIDLGGDTDTIAAIAGGLAGMCWRVPQRWIDQLARRDEIVRACEAFAAAIE